MCGFGDKVALVPHPVKVHLQREQFRIADLLHLQQSQSWLLDERMIVLWTWSEFRNLVFRPYNSIIAIER